MKRLLNKAENSKEQRLFSMNLVSKMTTAQSNTTSVNRDYSVKLTGIDRRTYSNHLWFWWIYLRSISVIFLLKTFQRIWSIHTRATIDQQTNARELIFRDAYLLRYTIENTIICEWLETRSHSKRIKHPTGYWKMWVRLPSCLCDLFHLIIRIR